MNKKRLTTILTVFGVLGTAATMLTTTRATIKAVKILEKEHGCKFDEIFLTKEDIMKVWKSYILPGSICLASAVSIFIANSANHKIQTALATALAAGTKTYKTYRDKIRREDPELDQRVISEMAKEHYSLEGIDLGEKVIFYDAISDRLFTKSMYEVRDSMYKFNRNFQLRGYSYLNELYDFLEVERTTVGGGYGFDQDWFYEGGLIPWIDYEVRKDHFDDGQEYYILDFIWPPIDISEIER